MRRGLLFVLLTAAGACGGDPPCGVDDEGEDYPVCGYEAEIEGVTETIEFCPGDQWAATDGCNSCGCDDRGQILCTSVTCGG